MTDYSAAVACEACAVPMLAWQLDKTCILWRCPRCGHVQRDPSLANADARPLDGSVRATAERLRERLSVRRLCRIAELRGARVLDVGCGDGTLSRQLAAHGATVVGVDPLAPFGPQPPGVTLCRGHLDDVELTAERFDLIIGLHVFEHVQDPIEFLGALQQRLSPTGRLVLVTPNGSSSALRVFGRAWWMLEDPSHVRFVSEDSLRRLAAAAGLQVLSTRLLILDSVGVEGASLVRLCAPNLSHGRGGVLETALGRIAAIAVAPVGVAARVLRPRWRPTLELIATRRANG